MNVVTGGRNQSVGTRGEEVLATTTRAAEYVRMSTEHQKYSTENQAEAIQQYAARRGLVIVRTYADQGKSGLSIDGRNALKQLIADVQNGSADFTTILVYDMSRWGRFQDADESAYYEYICKRAGINVQYCAEQFENDGSPVSTIVKGVKRAMAGEYSRELSVKVFTGQCRLIERGYRQGGPPGYGLRRRLIDQSGEAKCDLARGEQKSIQTDRIVLVPGPPEELETVQWIYRAFVEDGKIEREIAELLNGRGIRTDLGRPWTRGTVHQILINEKYIGNNVWNRASFKLKRKRVHNSPDMWIWADGVFEPIVDRQRFDAAQVIIRQRTHRFTNEEMLDILRGLLQANGYLSGLIIDEVDRGPSSSAYPNGSFDAVVSVFSIFFVPDMEGQVRELWRMVRPGGKLAVTTWGPRIFEPAYSRWLIAVGKERPDLVTAFNPWDRITDVVSVRKLLQDGGVRDAEVIPEESVQPLHSADDWWTIALGSGLRWTIDQMGPEAATRVKQDNVDWLTENKIDRVETNAIYAIGTKGP